MPVRPQAAVPALQPEDRTAPGEAPTIHVSIGRIEVRAVQTPSKPRRMERPAPQLSLDEYLKRYGRSG